MTIVHRCTTERSLRLQRNLISVLFRLPFLTDTVHKAIRVCYESLLYVTKASAPTDVIRDKDIHFNVTPFKHEFYREDEQINTVLYSTRTYENNKDRVKMSDVQNDEDAEQQFNDGHGAEMQLEDVDIDPRLEGVLHGNDAADGDHYENRATEENKQPDENKAPGWMKDTRMYKRLLESDSDVLKGLQRRLLSTHGNFNAIKSFEQHQCPRTDRRTHA